MNRARRAAFWATALAGASLDLASKSLVFSLVREGRTLPLVPPLLSLQLVTNRGIAGGLFPGSAWGVVSLAAVPLIAVAFLRRAPSGGTPTLAGALLLAGALGNAWDRLFLGRVRDFILVPGIPNFNLADAMLNAGMALLLLDWIVHERRPLGEARPAPAPQPDDGGFGDVGRDHGPRP